MPTGDSLVVNTIRLSTISVLPSGNYIEATAEPIPGEFPGNSLEAVPVEGPEADLLTMIGHAERATSTISCSWDPVIFRPEKKGYPAIAGFNFHDDNQQPGPVQVPGIGFQKPDCGSWVKTLGSGSEIRKIFHSCDTLSCPVCVDGAITKKAHDVDKRFDHYENAKNAENAVLIPGEYRRATPRQIIFTLSPSKASELFSLANGSQAEFLRLARAELNIILKDSDLVGGVVVYHGNRVQHPDTGLTGKEAKHLIRMEAMHAGNMKDDSPSADLYSHIRKQDHPEEYYYWSPHFHGIVYGKIMDSHEFEEKYPGWKYQNKGNVPNIGGLARYLFSHMAMIDDMRAVTWFGRLSSATLGVEELKTTYQKVICETTGLPWVIVASTEPSEIGKDYLEPVTEYRVFFRIHHKRGPPKMKFPKSETSRRRAVPAEVHEKGILALSKYCDEFGRL